MDFGDDTGIKDDNINPENEIKTNITTGNIEVGSDIDNIDEPKNKNDDNNTNPLEGDDTKKGEGNEKDNNLKAGDQVTLDDKTYIVDEKGNLVDENGAIFKEAKDVKEWINSFDKVDETEDQNSLSIKNIQDALGIDITDDDDKVKEYPDTPEGVKSYIEDIIETSKQEISEATINSLISKYPFIPDIINYYVANNNSLDGFNQSVDRSNIEIDENNVEQQKAIIKAAWKEQNRKGDVDSYIKYLESTGILFSTAQEELDGLKELDEQKREKLAQEAKDAEEKSINEQIDYWNGIKEVIDGRKIGKYTIPESIIIERDGKKLSVTPNDFFNYLYQVDNTGRSRYQYDLEKETPENKRNDALLRAYLKFVGGDYSNLIDMAINEKEVQKLRLKSKENRSGQIRINRTPKTTKKDNIIDFGE